MASLENSAASSLKDEKVTSNAVDAGEPISHDNAKRSWYRSALFQACVTGMCAFLSPGLWNSMNALGAGGRQEPYLVNAANSLVFGLMVVTCFFGSSITNRVGYRWALALGTAGYAPYAGGLVLNLNTGAEWLVFLGSVTCGLSAGLFWAVEGAIILGYPEPHKRGRYLALWLGFRNAGQIVGGIISLALNAKTNKAGSISKSTYYAFIALQCCGPLVAMFLSNPSKVQRADRSPVKLERHVGFVNEMKETWEIIKRPEVFMLGVIAIGAQWPSSYAGTFLSLYFSVRARSLAALCIAILGVIVNSLLGVFVDSVRFSKKTRARGAFIFIMSLFGGVWIWFTVLQLRYIAHKPKLDWTDGTSFAEAFVLYLFFQICYFLIQNMLYWFISQIAREQHELLRLSSFLRGLESAGSACGYGVSASKQLPYTVPLGINFALWGLSTVTAWFTVKDIGIKYNGPADDKERGRELEEAN
ncbi:hypothetical protein JCM8097_002915 [Rhodosporidiobolus ruineniae]